MRATLDILRKSGSSDAGYITTWGFSATWDWPAWFERLARAPNARTCVWPREYGR